MDDDGFIRTLSDGENGADYASDDSFPEFGSDGSDEEHSSSRNKNSSAKTPFFNVAAPAAWNFRGARQDAEQSLPFQTSIDHKIRAALAAVPDTLSKPSGASISGDETDDGEKSTKKSAQSISGSPADGFSEDDEGAEREDADEVGVPSTSDKVKRAGKKRVRKEAAAAATTFESLNLSRSILKSVERLQWDKPTPVQARAIPYILAGRDVCGSAVTGSGKTAAFALPILERLVRSGVDNATRCVILLPTRELAAQCHAVITNLGKHTPVRAALAVGGLSNKAQEVALRSRPHIIVATPGRLIDHVRNAQSFTLDDVEILVMDEADRLLEMGFKDEVEEIVRCTPTEGRQTLLFSATMSPKLDGLISLSLHNPVQMSVDPLFDVASTLSQEFVKLKPNHETDKDAVLFSLVTRVFKSRTIVFFRQKVVAHRFKILFGLTDLKCAELHGNLTQSQRLEALDAFRESEVDFLLCTDLAARGLDIAGVEAVVNYDMPGAVTEYVHRVGRTARAGAAGRACSIVCTSSNDERRLLRSIAKRARNQLSARVVQPAIVGKWRAWIDSLADAVKVVIKEEKQEKQLRMAEMELSKADNLLKHSDQIYARPARTWFQSSRQKIAAKDASRARAGVAERPAVAAKKRALSKPQANEEGADRRSDDRRHGRKRGVEVEAKSRRRDELSERQRDFGKQRSSKSKKRKVR